jgi:hypothetical protein
MLILQNPMDLLKSEPGPCVETCMMSYDDMHHVVRIKVEEVTDTKEEEDPEPPTPPIIKTEPIVSFMSLCI